MPTAKGYRLDRLETGEIALVVEVPNVAEPVVLRLSSDQAVELAVKLAAESAVSAVHETVSAEVAFWPPKMLC